MATPAPSPIDVGAALRRARTDRGLSLHEAAGKTLIPEQFLLALEGNAAPEEFPAPVYARFYLREYARYLSLEDEPLLASCPVPQPGDELPNLPLEETPPPRPLRRIAVVLALLALAALVVVGVVHELGGRGAPARTAATRSSAGAGALPRPAPTHASPPRVREIRALLTFSIPCWVQASTDGKQVFAQTLAAGERVRLLARRTLELLLGNPAGVRLVANGKPVHIPTHSGPVHLTLTLKAGRLVIR